MSIDVSTRHDVAPCDFERREKRWEEEENPYASRESVALPLMSSLADVRRDKWEKRISSAKITKRSAVINELHSCHSLSFLSRSTMKQRVIHLSANDTHGFDMSVSKCCQSNSARVNETWDMTFSFFVRTVDDLSVRRLCWLISRQPGWSFSLVSIYITINPCFVEDHTLPIAKESTLRKSLRESCE